MRVRSVVSAAVFSAAICAPVQAADPVDNWLIYDLGGSRTEALCLEAAQDAMLDYALTLGMRRVIAGEWAVFGYGLSREMHDATIICGQSGMRTSATLVIYSENAARATTLARRLVLTYLERIDELEEAWLNQKYREHGF